MSALSDKIVTEARRWIGTPYRHQAATRGAGTDCLGLIRGVWREPLPSIWASRGAWAPRPASSTPIPSMRCWKAR